MYNCGGGSSGNCKSPGLGRASLRLGETERKELEREERGRMGQASEREVESRAGPGMGTREREGRTGKELGRRSGQREREEGRRRKKCPEDQTPQPDPLPPPDVGQGIRGWTWAPWRGDRAQARP